MVEGAISEEGSHEELLAKNGEYNRLCSLQALEEREPERREVLH
jgi:ABC-type multidrug transport system fused ATPase/permease subunit